MDVLQISSNPVVATTNPYNRANPKVPCSSLHPGSFGSFGTVGYDVAFSSWSGPLLVIVTVAQQMTYKHDVTALHCIVTVDGQIMVNMTSQLYTVLWQ